MRKKTAQVIAICIAAVTVVAGIVVGAKIYRREKDPHWKFAKKLYNVTAALRELDNSWELKSLTNTTPIHYKTPDGDIITYYNFTTLYIGEEPSGYFGLDQTALAQVVDINALTNRRDCKVNGLEAVIGQLQGQTYLCWTFSPKYSCIIEYPTGTVAEADIFRMAESVVYP